MPQIKSQRPASLSLILIVTTIVVGLAVRFAPLGFPPLIVKYGGSALWALTLYWIFSAVLPTWQPSAVAPLAGVMATSVEFFKLYGSPSIDAFRHTLLGVLLLGRFFSVWDIGAYWVSIVSGAFVDYYMRRNASTAEVPLMVQNRRKKRYL